MKNNLLHGLALLFFMAWAYLLADDANAAEPADLSQCAALASTYAATPFALPMGDLDTLRLCISAQMAAMVSEREQARTERAITRNFGRDGE